MQVHTELIFNTSGLNRVVINEDGYVGIGATAPKSALHLKSFAGNSEDDIRIESNSNAGGSGSILFQRSRSTGTTLNQVVNGDSLGAIIFGGYLSSGNYSGSTNINSFYKGDGTTNLSNLVFRTDDTSRFEITETGKVVIPAIATYANDAAADADTTLPSGGLYKITGSRQLLIKP